MFRIAVSLAAVAFVGCSVEPAPLLTIPSGHPGHTDTTEGAYDPPANPFKNEVAPTPPPDHGHHEHGKAEPKKDYPLDVCVVSGEKLGSMGEPVVLTHEGREVRFCCAACVDEFKKNPAPYIKKLDDAEKNRKPAEDKPKDHKHEHHGGHK
jgi:hypothetical protein